MFFPWAEMEIPWSNIRTRYLATFYNLGPYSAELFLYRDIKRRISHLLGDPIPSQGNGGNEVRVGDQTQPPLSLQPTLQEIDAILSDFSLFFEIDPATGKLPLPIDLKWCSPKVQILVDILVEYRSPTFQGIVFVEQRQVASCLAQVLANIPQLQDFILCKELVGQNQMDDGFSQGMGLKYQNETVKLFRNRKINIRQSLIISYYL
jgi:endoribonuclease Dicer